MGKKYATRVMKQMVLFPEMNDGKEYTEEVVMFPVGGKKAQRRTSEDGTTLTTKPRQVMFSFLYNL